MDGDTAKVLSAEQALSVEGPQELHVKKNIICRPYFPSIKYFYKIQLLFDLTKVTENFKNGQF